MLMSAEIDYSDAKDLSYFLYHNYYNAHASFWFISIENVMDIPVSPGSARSLN